MSEQCCGNCQEFLKYKGNTVRGCCLWNGPRPSHYVADLSKQNSVSKNDGTRCPCYIAKETTNE